MDSTAEFPNVKQSFFYKFVDSLPKSKNFFYTFLLNVLSKSASGVGENTIIRDVRLQELRLITSNQIPPNWQSSNTRATHVKIWR